MKYLLTFSLLLIASTAFGQGAPPITFTEADGSPRKTAPSKIIVSNGSLSCSGSTCTITTTGAGGASFTDPVLITDTGADCFIVGPNGATNPTFQIVCNVASAATGLSVTGRAATAGVDLTVLSSGSNENLKIVPKGTGYLESTGPLRLSGTGSDSFVTPLSSSVPTKINVPLYDPGAFGQILAMGLASGATSTARAIMLIDQRSAGHQPTLNILSPDEQELFGFSWDGSNSIAKITNSAAGGAIQLSATIGAQLSATAFANLSTPGNGTFSYCNDCTVTSGSDNTCAGSGTGAFAFRLNGVWRCFNAQN